MRARIADGVALDDLLVPAFATVREAAKRTLGQRHFDVQLIGGMVLHEGAIAEMKTGEGKTLVATLAVYLNALSGKGVHVVTVNDYLARRDAEWMGQIYNFLGLTVGVIVHGLNDDQRREAYEADITYGTNNEYGFDYLRDNMKYELGAMVQRGHNFAIVDEVDSILIDEARTPLIISGPLDDRSELYNSIDTFIPKLTPEDYEVDEKVRSASFTEAGNEKLEGILREAGLLKGDSLYDVENVTVVHHLNQALRAHKLFQRDKDYIVRNGEVVIIDEFTGRMMPGRRYSEGLHQALEAKEHVQIQPENQTLASITFQNYFRMYDKLAGMTGTAATEAEEFGNIYGLEVVEVPTNRPMVRKDEDDEVYRTAEEKFKAILNLIEECQVPRPAGAGRHHLDREVGEARRAPAQQGLAPARLRQRDRPRRAVQRPARQGKDLHHPQRPLPRAGGDHRRPGGRAGRGDHRHQHGRPRHRHPARRQRRHARPPRARRRAAGPGTRREGEADPRRGRPPQGEGARRRRPLHHRHRAAREPAHRQPAPRPLRPPGRPRPLALLPVAAGRPDAHLLAERMDGMLQKLGLKEDEAIIHPWINQALEKAQQKVEARNFDIRKNLLKFDDVMNDQRRVIFEQRIDLMGQETVAETVADMRHEVIDDLVTKHIPEKAYPEQWDAKGLHESVQQTLNLDLPVEDWAKEEGIADDEVRDRLLKAADETAAQRAVRFGPDIMRQVEKAVLMQTLDHLWREHLVTLDHLRQVIGFRGYAQRDPLNEYKTEAFELFQAMLGRLREAVSQQLMRVEIVQRPPPPLVPEDDLATLEETHIDPLTGQNEMSDPDAGAAFQLARNGRTASAEIDPNDPSTWGKVQRNAPCPCGSGKKFKHCHGRFA